MTVEELYHKIKSGRITDANIENEKGYKIEGLTYIYRPFEPQEKQISIQFH